jgi:two-component system, OmpR family, sensor histidine kinase BaeS
LQAVRDDVMPFNEAEANLLIEQTELLTRLVDDLKVLSLADAGQLRLEQRSLDLVALVKQTLSGFELRAAQKNVRLELRAPERLELHGDAARLQQVLANLLENALRYANSSIALEMIVQNKNVRLHVLDDGVGIPEQDLERVFTRFYRVESSRSRESGGSGLGLAIAKALIELHHGQIRAMRSTRGAQFEITLPV